MAPQRLLHNLTSTIELSILVQGTPYLCTTCLRTLTTTRTNRPINKRLASTFADGFTRGVSGRLWKKEKDEVKNESFLEKRRRLKAEAGETVDEPTSLLDDGRWGKRVPSMVKTWDGLEHIGNLGHWWERPEVEAEQFTPYMTCPKLMRREEFVDILHRAAVEVLTLRQAGRRLTSSSRPNVQKTGGIAEIIREVEIAFPEGQSIPVLRYPTGATMGMILKSMEPYTPPAELDSVDAIDLERDQEPFTEPETEIEQSHMESSSEQPPSTISAAISDPPTAFSESFLSLPLTDPAMKFAILKRVTHLTSHVIQDPALPRLQSLLHVLDKLLESTTPTPTTVFEYLSATPTQGISTIKPALPTLPNVKIHPRRQTPVDKEMEVGRWKVIVRELQSRGLPVLGHKQDGKWLRKRMGSFRKGVAY